MKPRYHSDDPSRPDEVDEAENDLLKAELAWWKAASAEAFAGLCFSCNLPELLRHPITVSQVLLRIHLPRRMGR